MTASRTMGGIESVDVSVRYSMIYLANELLTELKNKTSLASE